MVSKKTDGINLMTEYMKVLLKLCAISCKITLKLYQIISTKHSRNNKHHHSTNKESIRNPFLPAHIHLHLH